MKKFLDLVLIFLITILLINLFSNDKQNISNNVLNISFEKNSYTIPASVGVLVDNYTASGITINTCNDISILNSGEKLVFNDDFCKDVEIKSGENYKISYAEEYSKFKNVGKYSLNAKIGEKEYIDQLEIENKGTIKKLFVGIIYAPIYNLVIGLIEIFDGSFGWAIICVTIILRLLLLWPQHRMMISQKKLQQLQPKIKKIQEDHKGNQQMIGMKMMELYKTENVNPVGSCGFLLIQMPILLVIYRIILGIQDPSNIYYLYSFSKSFLISDISFSFYSLNLLQVGGVQGVILGLIVGIIQFIQIKLSLNQKDKDIKSSGVVLEKKSGDDKYSQMMPDPEMINKFMLYGMPVMVAMFTYTLFAGVGIYWGISTLFMLFQQLFVNKILKK
ncbi:MAG: YidC/Oxa1 family membrane protein insertase [Candidatus Gracilibacteria bacterium]|nr:YidC/Oxa1 family membrane protein insertase [Candidatus Gracilibacteria bacterium]